MKEEDKETMSKTFTVKITYNKKYNNWEQFSDKCLIKGIKEILEENTYGINLEITVERLTNIEVGK